MHQIEEREYITFKNHHFRCFIKTHTDRQRQRQSETDKDSQRQTETATETDKDSHRQTKTDSDRDRQRRSRGHFHRGEDALPHLQRRPERVSSLIPLRPNKLIRSLDIMMTEYAENRAKSGVICHVHHHYV